MKVQRILWNILLVIYLITVVSSVTYEVMTGEVGRKAIQFWFSGIYCMCTGLYLLFSGYADNQKSECKEVNVKEHNKLLLFFVGVLQYLFLIVAIGLFVVETRILKNGDMGSISMMVLVLIMEQCYKKIEAQTKSELRDSRI